MPETGKKPKRIYKISLRLLILCGLIFIGIVTSSYWVGVWRTTNWAKKIFTTIQPVRENNEKYQFIYPLLLYNFGQAKQFYEDHGLEGKINDYIKTQVKIGNAENISVSVRDFFRLHWAEVNGNIQYHPGSMMKVIILMGYFREAEPDPVILQQQLLYSQSVDRQTNAVPFALATDLVVGKSYTIEYLLQDMIANSDNGAETLLLDNVDNTTLNQAYTDLGIPSPDTVADYTISSSQYTDFLRILYNSTYLSEKYSEQALATMSQSTYKAGISAGVPANVTAAQKYGEHVNYSGNTLQSLEISDCGIVYPKNHPYSICVMTKKAITTNQGSTDEQTLAGIIKDISAIVYNYNSTLPE